MAFVPSLACLLGSKRQEENSEWKFKLEVERTEERDGWIWKKVEGPEYSRSPKS